MSGVVIVCQGPPRCGLQGDDAVAEQARGCIWCRRIVVEDDGSEAREGPPLLIECEAQ